jgi:hypothetical protein
MVSRTAPMPNANLRMFATISLATIIGVRAGAGPSPVGEVIRP